MPSSASVAVALRLTCWPTAKVAVSPGVVSVSCGVWLPGATAMVVVPVAFSVSRTVSFAVNDAVPAAYWWLTVGPASAAVVPSPKSQSYFSRSPS